MSIKAVKSLIKNVRTTSSDIVNYDFKTPLELITYLNSVRKSIKEIAEKLDKGERLVSSSVETATKIFTIDRYGKGPKAGGLKSEDLDSPHEIIKIPNLETLKKHFGGIKELHNNIETLESIELQLNSLLKDVKGKTQAAKYIKSMKTAALKALQKALNFLEKLGKQHQPELFKKIVDSIIENLLTRIDKARFNKKLERLFCTITVDEGANTLWFTRYLALEKFVDDSGYVYPNYYIVFTAKIDPAMNETFYVNTFTKFKAPGTFRPGHQFKDPKGGGHAVDALLSAENFKSVVRRMPLPTERGDIKAKDFKLKGLIKDVDQTDDHTILVTFTKSVTQKNLDEAIVKVFGQLRNLLAPKSRQQLSHRPTRSGENLAVEFMYLPSESEDMEKMNLSIRELNLMKNRLGLTDEQVKDIIRIMHKG